MEKIRLEKMNAAREDAIKALKEITAIKIEKDLEASRAKNKKKV